VRSNGKASHRPLRPSGWRLRIVRRSRLRSRHGRRAAVGTIARGATRAPIRGAALPVYVMPSSARSRCSSAIRFSTMIGASPRRPLRHRRRIAHHGAADRPASAARRPDSWFPRWSRRSARRGTISKHSGPTSVGSSTPHARRPRGILQHLQRPVISRAPGHVTEARRGRAHSSVGARSARPPSRSAPRCPPRYGP